MLRVFVQAAAGSPDKHTHDEKTFAPRRTVTLVRPYPFPYGFVIDTDSEDGDNVDCYVITTRPLAVGDIVECEPAGLLEQFENGAPDHKVLATLAGEPLRVDPSAVAAVRSFIAAVFAAFPATRLELGALHDAEAARAHVLARRRLPDAS